MDRRTLSGNRTGTSLMEAVLVMALMFLLLLGTAETLVLALHVQSRARSIRDMTGLAADRLEKLRAEAAASGLAGALPSIADGSAQASGRDGKRYALAWTKAPGTDSPFVVQIRITPEGWPDRVFSIPLFISRELGF